MSVGVRFAGGEGHVASLAGEVLAIVASRAFAPGTPMSFTIDVDPPIALEGRALGSRRREDARFDVRIRLVSFRRTDRERLEASLR